MKRTLIAIALGATTLAGGAQAIERPVNARQLNQERRIDAGVRSGKLSPREAARLKRQQAAIRADAAHRRATHGGLTARDKRLIHARQDSANATILQKKNNTVRGKDHLKL